MADDDGDGLFDEDCVKVMPSKSCFMYVFEIYTVNQIMICIHVVLYKQQTQVQ